MIYNPLEEFDLKFKNLHLENTNKYFEAKVTESSVDVEENRKTVKDYEDSREKHKKLKKRLFWWKFLRVVMCITIILIPIVLWKITPKIRAMREELSALEKKIDELLSAAYQQMSPLNSLFSEEDALKIIEQTIPDIDFYNSFSVEQELDMEKNYDFNDPDAFNTTTLDCLSGRYKDNPFLFEKKLVHTMGEQIYHGQRVIHWTESYRDSEGRLRTRFKSETLHATVCKPKPFYETKHILNYCAQGGDELSFTRDATHLNEKSDKELDRYVKKGERKIRRKAKKAVKNNEEFTAMSNTDFEVLFDALDRTDEVQFRALFTPMAQTNMVDLIRSDLGYGDDFDFIKRNRTNKIYTKHSQNRPVRLYPGDYHSYDFDKIKENFVSKNAEYFKGVYFDFAPVWAIPLYQESPTHSLESIEKPLGKFTYRECESLVNGIEARSVAHPNTKTPIIFKTMPSVQYGDKYGISVTAYSYDVVPRVDLVSVYGGDGRFHMVDVPWDEYIPLEAKQEFTVSTDKPNESDIILSSRVGMYLYDKI